MTALYVLGAFLLLLLAGVVLAPLVEREPPEGSLEDLAPRERREAAVEALSELEFEYRTDKLPEEEYRRLRTHYGRIALEAEREIEGDTGRTGERRAGAGAAGTRGDDGPGSCPACDRRVPRGARYCPACGARQREPGTSTSRRRSREAD